MDSTSGVRREAAEDVAPGGGGMDGVGGGGVGMGAGNCSIAGASGAEFFNAAGMDSGVKARRMRRLSVSSQLRARSFPALRVRIRVSLSCCSGDTFTGNSGLDIILLFLYMFRI